MLPTEAEVPEIDLEPRVLREYQTEAFEAVLEDWANEIRRVGVVLPTGAGKSTVIGKLVSHAYHLGLRVAVIAHRGELLDQIIRDTRAVDPTIPVEHFGLVRAEHDDHTAPIVVAMFQTLANEKRIHAVGDRQVVIVDETHHIIAETYLKVATRLGIYDGTFFCGFTATMYRAEMTKGKSAARGLGDVIEKVSYEKNLRWAIENDYLVPPRGLTVRIEALNQLNKIKNVAGDFNQKELGEVMEAAVQYTVDAIELHARDRKSIVFAASVAASIEIADMINERGNLRAAATVGSMGYEERKPIYDQYRRGELDVLVTVGVLTEGADFPMCDCVVMARPTRSRILYSQMVGRALRLYEGKEDALVLDLTGTVRGMKLIHLSELVHGYGITVEEVDEDGGVIEPVLCPTSRESVLTCMCEDCVAERTPEKRVRVQRMGPVDMTPIDLLADGDSDVLWLMTPAGINFIPLEDHWVHAVFPFNGDHTTGMYCVGTKNTRTGGGGYMEVDHEMEDGTPVPKYYPLAEALKKAEQWVVDRRMVLPNKNQSWRRRSQAPSEGQARYANMLGIPLAQDMNRARLSDEISIHLAAEHLDWAVAPRSGGDDDDQ